VYYLDHRVPKGAAGALVEWPPPIWPSAHGCIFRRASGFGPAGCTGKDPNSLTWPDIQQEVERFIDWAGIGIPDPDELDRCYLVVLPTAAVMTDAPGACGYHQSGYYEKADGDHNFFCAVISTQGVSTALSGDDFINQISYCISHELAEMFTNPDGRGWFADADSTAGRPKVCEVGDICETKGYVQTLGKWTIEKYWSQSDHGCLDPSAPAPSAGGGHDPIPVPTDPGSPPRAECEALAQRISQLESAMAQLEMAPASPSRQKQLQQLEHSLETAQATYQTQCVVKPKGGHHTSSSTTNPS
jgi:hypothetical protein